MSTSWTPDFGTIDRTPPAWAPKKPVRIALLGDFSAGASSGRLETGADLGRRKPINVEFDNVEDALSRLDVTLRLSLGEDSAVELPITELESFHPDELYRSLDVFSQLSGLRKQLNNTATFDKAAKQVLAWAESAGIKTSLVNRRKKARGSALAADAKLSDFARLVGLPSTDEKADTSVDALLQRIVGPFVVKADSPQKAALLASVDAGLSDAMRAVLHHPDLQAMEALWRGVDFLLRRLETSSNLQVHLIDISAEEFAADLSASSDLGETGLYQLLVDTPSQSPNGGYSLVCGLFQFEATPPHAELLGRMSKIAHHAAAPFVTSMALDDLSNRRVEPHELVQQAIRALQSQPSSSHLCLMGPRFMLRHPYGKRSDPISSFEFEEFNASEGLRGMLWGHPALLAACAVAGRDGLTIGDLPFYHFKDAEGDTIALPCTERLVNVDMSHSLRGWGISPLMAHKGAPELRIAGLDAVNGAPLGKAAAPGAGPRAEISTKVDFGKKTSVSVTAKAPTPAPSRAPAVADEIAPEAEETASVSAGDDDLDALLASLDGDSGSDSADAGDGASAEASGSGDDDLDALLASLGGDDSPAPASEAAAPEEDAMDPELAALLASLE
jgi:type VI secretion system protein ImpC